MTRSSNGKKVSLDKKHFYNTSPDVFTFCPQKTGNWNFLDEFLHVWELSTFHSVQLSISSYGLKTFSHHPKVLFDFCEKRWKMTKIKFLGRGVLRDEFSHWWELSEWHSRHFSIFWYGQKIHFLLLVLKNQGKSNFWDEEFFGMSSYMCENFQLFILCNF